MNKHIICRTHTYTSQEKLGKSKVSEHDVIESMIYKFVSETYDRCFS